MPSPVSGGLHGYRTPAVVTERLFGFQHTKICSWLLAFCCAKRHKEGGNITHHSLYAADLGFASLLPSMSHSSFALPVVITDTPNPHLAQSIGRLGLFEVPPLLFRLLVLLLGSLPRDTGLWAWCSPQCGPYGSPQRTKGVHTGKEKKKITLNIHLQSICLCFLEIEVKGIRRDPMLQNMQLLIKHAAASFVSNFKA